MSAKVNDTRVVAKAKCFKVNVEVKYFRVNNRVKHFRGNAKAKHFILEHFFSFFYVMYTSHENNFPFFNLSSLQADHEIGTRETCKVCVL